MSCIIDVDVISGHHHLREAGEGQSPFIKESCMSRMQWLHFLHIIITNWNLQFLSYFQPVIILLKMTCSTWKEATPLGWHSNGRSRQEWVGKN